MKGDIYIYLYFRKQTFHEDSHREKMLKSILLLIRYPIQQQSNRGTKKMVVNKMCIFINRKA